VEIKPIAYFRSPLKEKFGTPRQAGLVQNLTGAVEFCDGFKSEMLDGLEGFDYIWLIWGFSLNRETEGIPSKVRPPRLGGNKRMGVYATRSPYRPNPLGLSSVRISRIDAVSGRIDVLGADLVDGTPIYDIKPYLEYTDSHTDIRSGFAGEAPARLKVRFSVAGQVPGELSSSDLAILEDVLSQDPRPAYHDDSDRVYGLDYKGKNVRFKVEADTLTVLSID